MSHDAVLNEMFAGATFIGTGLLFLGQVSVPEATTFYESLGKHGVAFFSVAALAALWGFRLYIDWKTKDRESSALEKKADAEKEMAKATQALAETVRALGDTIQAVKEDVQTQGQETRSNLMSIEKTLARCPGSKP